ncbi:DUF5694 domain-containing protein [Ekhidna sp.]|uniref:DUF5694 domain-containing protein n=1 Tax=Ekhidna sp. TaxID=2608089 RepID=UPI003CCBFBB5
MKTIITLLFAITSSWSIAQKINVTIIGTAHSFNKDYQPLQSFNEAQSFIEELSPDMICIEAIPITDTASLKEIWPNTMKRADRLRDTLKNTESSHDNLPNHGNIDFWTAYSANKKIMKGAKAYASYDFWNGYYQWFQVLNDGDSLEYFSKYYRDQSKSEYGLIVFPAAQGLGIDHLYGIDYRDGEKEFLAANSKVMKKLFFSLKWKPIRVYLKTQKKYKKAEKAGKLIEFINSDEFQDAFSNLIDDLPNRLPKSEEAQFIKDYWLNRNEIMANRIIETANANGAQNILLTVGSAHVTHIKRFLEAEGHNVTTYGQILNTQNQ